jgi:hypothetical protein
MKFLKSRLLRDAPPIIMTTFFSKAAAWAAAVWFFLPLLEFLHWPRKNAKMNKKTHLLFICFYYISGKLEFQCARTLSNQATLRLTQTVRFDKAAGKKYNS